MDSHKAEEPWNASDPVKPKVEDGGDDVGAAGEEQTGPVQPPLPASSEPIGTYPEPIAHDLRKTTPVESPKDPPMRRPGSGLNLLRSRIIVVASLDDSVDDDYILVDESELAGHHFLLPRIKQGQKPPSIGSVTGIAGPSHAPTFASPEKKAFPATALLNGPGSAHQKQPLTIDLCDEDDGAEPTEAGTGKGSPHILPVPEDKPFHLPARHNEASAATQQQPETIHFTDDATEPMDSDNGTGHIAIQPFPPIPEHVTPIRAQVPEDADQDRTPLPPLEDGASLDQDGAGEDEEAELLPSDDEADADMSEDVDYEAIVAMQPTVVLTRLPQDFAHIIAQAVPTRTRNAKKYKMVENYENYQTVAKLKKYQVGDTCGICPPGTVPAYSRRYTGAFIYHMQQHNLGRMKFRCFDCGRLFSEPPLVRKHKRKVHDANVPGRREATKALYARIKNSVSSYKAGLVDGNECPFCPAGTAPVFRFHHQAPFIAHMKSHEGTASTVECPICRRHCTYLASHMNQVHRKKLRVKMT